MKFYLRERSLESNPWKLFAELDPDKEEFGNLVYPPFILELSKLDTKQFEFSWGDLRIDGYLKGKQVISKSLSGLGVDRQFHLLPDDTSLVADGADTTRVVLRATDEFDAVRTYANDPIMFTLEGPAELIGDNPFALIGGTGAVWIRAKEEAGVVRLTAKHPRLGSKLSNSSCLRFLPNPFSGGFYLPGQWIGAGLMLVEYRNPRQFAAFSSPIAMTYKVREKLLSRFRCVAGVESSAMAGCTR